MTFFHWLIRSGVLRPSSGSRRTRPNSRRPRVEALESRLTPSTFTVMNLGDSGPGSLRQAVLDANALPGADVIAFSPHVRGTITLTGGEVSITDRLTLDGPGAARLAVSGNDAGRVFHVAGSAAEVTLEGLTITRGRSAQGGGIFNEAGATLTVRRAVLSDNEVSGDLPDGVGGGIYNQGILAVACSTFTGNRAVFGGGISTDSDGSLLTVIETVFVANQAGVSGAIDVFGTPTTVRGSTFVGNVARGVPGTSGSAQGGAINAFAPTVTLCDNTFRANKAIGADGPGGAGSGQANGGAVAATADTFVVNNCTFIDNVARGGDQGDALSGLAGGGALAIFGYGVTGGPILATVSNSRFLGNQAVAGAISSTDAGLAAPARGEAIIQLGGTLNVNDTTFTGNGAWGGRGIPGIQGGPGLGGAIANAGVLTMTSSRLSANVAWGGAGGDGAPGGFGVGGGLYDGPLSTATLTDVEITDNRAIGGVGGLGGDGGGGLGGGTCCDDLSATTLDGCVVRDNEAQGGAGGVGGDGGRGQGGGLYAGPSTTVTLRHDRITNNEAEGGARGSVGGQAGQGEGGGLWIDASAQVCLDQQTRARLRHNHTPDSGDDWFGSFMICP